MFIRKAFSMLELIFVIIILGIVSSIGSEIIVQVYQSYILQKSTHNASLKSELAINQIANRLLYRIDLSMLARIPGETGITEGVHVYPVNEVPLTGAQVDTYTALEWISYENDGFTQSKQPAWSSFTDLTESSFNSIKTTGSALTNETTILNNLAGAIAAPTPAIIFNTADYRTGQRYNPLCMYRNDGCIFPVTIVDDTNLSFTGAGDRLNGEMVYSEFYQLLASANAIVPENGITINGITTWELALYSNYQPWLGDNYLDGRRSILARNVSVFRFKQELNSVRIKLCTNSRISPTEQIATCKEKSVIR